MLYYHVCNYELRLNCNQDHSIVESAPEFSLGNNNTLELQGFAQPRCILFQFPMVQFWNGLDHSCSCSYDEPFHNKTIGFQTLDRLVFRCLVSKPPLHAVTGLVKDVARKN